MDLYSNHRVFRAFEHEEKLKVNEQTNINTLNSLRRNVTVPSPLQTGSLVMVLNSTLTVHELYRYLKML